MLTRSETAAVARRVAYPPLALAAVVISVDNRYVSAAALVAAAVALGFYDWLTDDLPELRRETDLYRQEVNDWLDDQHRRVEASQHFIAEIVAAAQETIQRADFDDRDEMLAKVIRAYNGYRREVER